MLLYDVSVPAHGRGVGGFIVHSNFLAFCYYVILY